MNESFSVKITNGLWMEYFYFQPKMSSHMKPSTEMVRKGLALKLNCKNDMKIWSEKYFGFSLFGETRRSNYATHMHGPRGSCHNYRKPEVNAHSSHKNPSLS